MNKFWSYLDRYRNKVNKAKRLSSINARREAYLSGGKIPWSEGYAEYKEEKINLGIQSHDILKSFSKKNLPENYGYRIDERIVEYPWIFSKLPSKRVSILDAGSTFNFRYLVNHPRIKDKDLTIFTFAPEDVAFYKKRISYVFGDLRDMYFDDATFDFVVSQSTIEHIDMDNSVYGYELEHNKDENVKSYDYMKAIGEMVRVIKPGGKLLLTFPFGRFEHHGFFQQFDEEMIGRMFELFKQAGHYQVDYLRYHNDGWQFAIFEEVMDATSHNPHTGKGAGDDHAAHSRAIACIEFIKDI